MSVIGTVFGVHSVRWVAHRFLTNGQEASGPEPMVEAHVCWCRFSVLTSPRNRPKRLTFFLKNEILKANFGEKIPFFYDKTCEMQGRTAIVAERLPVGVLWTPCEMQGRTATPTECRATRRCCERPMKCRVEQRVEKKEWSLSLVHQGIGSIAFLGVSKKLVEKCRSET